MSIKLHSPIARLLYEKFEHTQEHLNSKHEYWYLIREELLSPYLLERFMHAEQDEETTEFLKHCFDKSDWFFTQLYHAISKSILTWFMTVTSSNGLLDRGSMFVFSNSQFRNLMDIDENWKALRLLDLGAGDGRVTMRMSPMFEEIYVTEISPVMRWRLRQVNFTVVDIEDWDKPQALIDATRTSADIPSTVSSEEPSPVYDVVSCLNLLDRCATPLTLLRRIRAILRPETGRLVLALVLPLNQYVETTDTNEPLEVMEISKSRAWEVQLDSFVRNVLEPVGYELMRWTRLPYLCEGDFSRSFYSLNDIVMVARPRADERRAQSPTSAEVTDSVSRH